MSILRQLELVFAVRAQARPNKAPNWHLPIVDLAIAGYPGFYWTEFFPTPDGAARYAATKAICWPDVCVACGGQAKTVRPCLRLRRFGPMVWKTSTLSSNVPYCEAHAEHAAHLAMSVFNGTPMSISVVARREDFLRATLLRTQSDGEHEPPWFAFPGALPGVGWNQGNKEAWMHRAFAPFWRTRSASEREDYLNRWSAPLDWAEWLQAWR